MCFVRIAQQTATFALYIIKWLVFITMVESVYCAVRTESLHTTETFSPVLEAYTEKSAPNTILLQKHETKRKLWSDEQCASDVKISPCKQFNPLNAELNPICYLLALLAHHFLHVSRIRVKSLTLRLLMSYIYIYIYGVPILDVSRSHTMTHHSR